jgi:hypothetical protein
VFVSNPNPSSFSVYHFYLLLVLLSSISESLNLWLSLYLDFAGSILVLAVTVFSVAMKDQYKAADVGLAFSNVIQMLVFYTWVIRAIADTISYWSSVERIAGLATTTPQEEEISSAELPDAKG